MHSIANISEPPSDTSLLTVTCFEGGEIDFPHLRQNLDSSGMLRPQDGQFTVIDTSPGLHIPCRPSIKPDNARQEQCRDILLIRQVMYGR